MRPDSYGAAGRFEAIDQENVILTSKDSNVIDAFHELEQCLTVDQTVTIAKTSDFDGWNKVHQEIAVESNKILDDVFDRVTGQILQSAKAMIETSDQRKKEVAQEAEEQKRKLEELDVPREPIDVGHQQLMRYIETLTADNTKWIKIQRDTERARKAKGLSGNAAEEKQKENPNENAEEKQSEDNN